MSARSAWTSVSLIHPQPPLKRGCAIATCGRWIVRRVRQRHPAAGGLQGHNRAGRLRRVGRVSPALGHPRVFLRIEPDVGFVECGYCDRRFIFEGGPADKPA